MPQASALWFDLIVLVVLIVGFQVGKRKEALPQFKSIVHWLVTLVICLFLYKAPAIWLAREWSMQPDTMALMIFPIEFLLVFLLLILVRQRARKGRGETVNKEPFGNWEVPLTKLAGVLRFLVFLLVVMAWISGKYVTEKDLLEHKAFNEENFGGISFPSPTTIHNDIFNGSYTGRFTKAYLGVLLMKGIPHVEYADKPSDSLPGKKGPKKLRELNDEFDRDKDGKGIVDGPEKNKVAPKEPTVAPAAGIGNLQIVYHDLTLRGISGSGDKRFALINNQTFSAGESNSIKIESRKITIKCVQILESSVLIQVENKPEPIELKIGIATNLKGEPVDK